MLTQHSRDSKLLENLISYLGCGYCSSPLGYNCTRFVVTKFSDITEKILPFFDKYPLVGAKRQDYLSFVKVAVLMQAKANLTKEGLEQIKQIKVGMNIVGV